MGEGDPAKPWRSRVEGAALPSANRAQPALDLEFANEMLTGAGEEVDKSAPKRWRAEAAAEKAEAFRKGR